MSWQEELRRLDEELAAGQLSAEQYRTRRDQLLSSAAASGTPAPNQPPDASSVTQTFRPVADPNQPAGPPDSGSTNADQTQVVPGAPGRPPGQGGWQASRPASAPAGDQTQVLPGVPTQSMVGGVPRPAPWPGGPQSPQSPPRGFAPQPPQGGWSGQESDPPWGGGDFPPLATAGGAEWLKQGPEVFERSHGSKGRQITLIVVAIVLVAGLGVGAFFLFGRGGPSQQAGGGHQTVQTTTSKPKPKPRPAHPDEPLLQQLAPVVGTINARGATFTDSGDLLSKHLIDEAAANLFSAAGVQQVAWRDGSKAADQDGPTADYFSVMAISLDGPDSAAQLAQRLQEYQHTNGFVQVPQALPAVPSAVVVQKNVSPNAGLYRGIWVVGSDVIWVNVDQTPLSSESALGASFGREIQALLPSFPAQ